MDCGSFFSIVHVQFTVETSDIAELWEHVATVDATGGTLMEEFPSEESSASFCEETSTGVNVVETAGTVL